MIFLTKAVCFVSWGNKPVFFSSCQSHSLQFFIRRVGNKAKNSNFFVSSNRKRVSLTPTQGIPITDSPNLSFRALLRPLVFTICFSGCCFLGAFMWQYENMRKKAQERQFFHWFDQTSVKRKRGEVRQKVNMWWNNQTEGQKIASVIIAINSIVFLLWRIPAVQPMMMKYFLCSPAMKSTCVPMFLSTFSHFSLLHMAANMFVLYSFSTTSVSFFGKEQFVALYCSAGVISSFFSHLYKVIRGSTAPSLGASGALMAILSSSCVQHPDALLQVVFLPFLVLPAGHAIKLLMTVDTIGILAKWKVFDHAGHLGGAIFGILYLRYGQEYIWNKREPFMIWWHKIRAGR